MAPLPPSPPDRPKSGHDDDPKKQVVIVPNNVGPEDIGGAVFAKAVNLDEVKNSREGKRIPEVTFKPRAA